MITKNARERLGAHVVGHDDLGPAVMLPNGMLKTSRGLIAPQSKYKGGERSGTPDVPEQPQTQAILPVQQPEPVQTPSKRSKRKKEESVQVAVTVDGFGSIPTQYTHVYTGPGIVVLGMSKLSFQPEQAEFDDGKVLHAVKLSPTGDTQYIYCGNYFVDKDGVKNILLIAVNKED